MIDRKSRDVLARALRRYCAGLITNDALDEVFVDWRDRGAVAVKQMSWQLYSDHLRHYATEDHALANEVRTEIAR